MSMKTVLYDSQMKALMYIRRPLSPPNKNAPFLGGFFICGLSKAEIPHIGDTIFLWVNKVETPRRFDKILQFVSQIAGIDPSKTDCAQ